MAIYTYRNQFSKKKQLPPYVLPLPYGIEGGQDTTDQVPKPSGWTPRGLGFVNDDLASQIAYRMAYDRFFSEAKGASASLGETLAERHKSYEMIGNRATSVLAGLMALKAGSVRSALHHWGFKQEMRKKNSSWVRVGKGKTYAVNNKKVLLSEASFKRGLQSYGSLWLEYWFGWSPLLADISEGVEILRKPAKLKSTPGAKVKGSGTYRVTQKNSVISNDFLYGSYDVSKIDATYGCRIQAQVSVTSETALKLNQLGLANPAATLWALTPWSWAIDWLLNIGAWLQSHTTAFGLKLDWVQTTYRVKVAGQRTYIWLGHPSYKPAVAGWSSTSAFKFTRSVGGLSIPTLRSRTGSGISSLTRAATAIAVLAGFMKRS